MLSPEVTAYRFSIHRGGQERINSHTKPHREYSQDFSFRRMTKKRTLPEKAQVSLFSVFPGKPHIERKRWT